MRRYDTAVEVETSADDVPVRFSWHGRRYDVVEILERWRARSAWWRDALDPGRGLCALQLENLEEHVWRVSALRAANGSVGVYDLARGRGWRLLQVAD
ncbi:DUF6504 family protein [Gephyromycinifex aptenodytis]|uniref:DUF6504 family protein n=1 Tax=Gephyromycinifex aptenodytis TaxID=2716227 RepID=UPI001446815F|nr:DUF6504 family protein [Gephyromycinifex aptenodytis]